MSYSYTHTNLFVTGFVEIQYVKTVDDPVDHYEDNGKSFYLNGNLPAASQS